ncbi:MAG: molybdenum cofactor guanylyltransferase, partial [Thermodesulfovibrionales bacterium]
MTVYGSNLSGAILAGGKNTRFPKIKAFIKIDGITIIEKNISILRHLFEEVIISANQTEIYKPFDVPIVQDSLPSRGPLTGIYSCLKVCRGNALFVVACDMPLVSKEIIITLCDYYLSVKGSVSALVPIFMGRS